MTASILVLNVGSSSLKFAAFARRSGGPKPILTGSFDENSDEGVVLRDSHGRDLPSLALSRRPERRALVLVLAERVRNELPGPLVVGHRVVHSGGRFVAPVALDKQAEVELRGFAPLAPLHQTANLDPVVWLRERFPDLPQLAVFDDAFHAGMPEVARRLPLPDDLAKGLRRHGFHGLSYASIARQMARLSKARCVVAVHLAGGASLCAMRDGESVDTTMGLTPLDGMMMGTRSGALDPGALLYLMKRDALAPEEMEEMLCRQSGLMGVSGISADLRDLFASGEVKAAQAIDLYCHLLTRHVGAMASSLGGLEALVFTGGAGQGQPEIRSRVCGRLGWLGLELDPAANARSSALVSTPNSRVEVWVLPAEEEAEIARAVDGYLEGSER
ncbi:acetate/propionate family kinase [Limimaricola sp. G21655-S1]|uniref:acetate/propionate family kinase n=1 Tax=Limimaricola sp. G21655-S1 TaxID=3014768 RepID=UPI0022AEDDC4|nr:acetate/propionate family kinase [Limimaricola sp. G21655-S1]MCZ4260556.1 acetate/propionate family kinase [Limimaricola sp. G21655-S1]